MYLSETTVRLFNKGLTKLVSSEEEVWCVQHFRRCIAMCKLLYFVKCLKMTLNSRIGGLYCVFVSIYPFFCIPWGVMREGLYPQVLLNPLLGFGRLFFLLKYWSIWHARKIHTLTKIFKLFRLKYFHSLQGMTKDLTVGVYFEHFWHFLWAV